MAFIKKVWSNGQILDAENMNRIEAGIDDLSNGNNGSASPTWEYNIYKDNLGAALTEEFDIAFETELGTLNDDTSGVTGDKVTSDKRLRMTDKVAVAEYDTVYVDIPSGMSMWINIYDTTGKFLRAASSSTIHSSMSIAVTSDIGYIWVIFRKTIDTDGGVPSAEEMAKVRVYGSRAVAPEDTVEPELLTTISVVAKNAHNLDIQMEGGSIDRESGIDSDTIVAYGSSVRSGLLVSIDGATKISFNTYLPRCNAGYVIFYDSDMNVMRSQTLTPFNPEDTNVSYGVIDLNGDEKYFRVVFSIGIPALKTINVTVFNAKRVPKETKKKIWHTDYAFDSITYPVSGGNTTCSTLRLFLPPNYSATSINKVPLIYYLPGSGNWYGWNHPTWPGTNDTLYNCLSYCMNEGFAVCCIYGWGNYYHAKYNPGSSHPYPVRTCLQVIEDGIKWICSRYNIDETNIHVMSKSQGGQNSAYWVSRPFPGLRSVGMCAPVVDYFSMPAEAMYNAPRKCLVEELDLKGEDAEWFCSGSDYYTYTERSLNFFKANKHKFAGMNEAWTDLHGNTIENLIQESWDSGRLYWNGGSRPENANTSLTNEDIYTHSDYVKFGKVPCKLWSGDKDDNTPHCKNVEFINQLQNGGVEAELKTYSGGHSSYDYGNMQSGKTALGIDYSNVGAYYVENIDFIRKHMPV